MKFGDYIMPAEKEGKEKHVPFIEAPEIVKKGEFFQITITVGKEVPHPNTVEHHIKWIQVFAVIEGRPYNPVHVATFDMGPTYSNPEVSFKMKLEANATLFVLEYCNVHGLWENYKSIKVE